MPRQLTEAEKFQAGQRGIQPIYRTVFNPYDPNTVVVRLTFLDGTTVDYRHGDKGYDYQRRLAMKRR